jgi:hypothetical protein
VSIDQASQDIRTLFDWNQGAVGAASQAGDPSSHAVANDDLELALKLLACNSRDREQFMASRGAA